MDSKNCFALEWVFLFNKATYGIVNKEETPSMSRCT